VMDGDGRSLVPALAGAPLPARQLYAESFAPLFDFGWAGLRAVREGPWKYIAAPRAELYDIGRDPGESVNRISDDPERAARLDRDATVRSPAEPGASAPAAPDAVARLRSLGYLSGTPRAGSTGTRPDPKDRIAVASRLATVTSGEVRGDELVATLEAVLRDDPGNPQAHLRLGFAEVERGRCAQAEPHLRAALDAGMPSADAGLGLAACLGQAGDLTGAREALVAARRAEPGNPVVAANLGLLELSQGHLAPAIAELRTALADEPGLLEARFALARALARVGDRTGAAAEAATLLGQLPADAPQRAEVRRLLDALR
jgi:Flp pilus assembly protein TadD